MKLTHLNKEIEAMIAMKGNPYWDFARMIPAPPVCQRSHKLYQKYQQNFLFLFFGYGILHYGMFTNRNKSHYISQMQKNKSRKLDLAPTQNIHYPQHHCMAFTYSPSCEQPRGYFFSLSLKCLISPLSTWTCNVGSSFPCSRRSTA